MSLMSFFSKNRGSMSESGHSVVKPSNALVEYQSPNYQSDFFSTMYVQPDMYRDDESVSLAPSVAPPTGSTWRVDGKLILKLGKAPKNWDDIMEALDYIIDNYSGVAIFKPVFLVLYLLAGTHLKPFGPQGSAYYLLESEINHRVVINHNFPLVHTRENSLIWKYRTGKGKALIDINFTCSLTKTTRSGIPYHHLYENPLIGGPSIPDLKTLLEDYPINVSILPDGTYHFTSN